MPWVSLTPTCAKRVLLFALGAFLGFLICLVIDICGVMLLRNPPAPLWFYSLSIIGGGWAVFTGDMLEWTP